MIALTTTAAEIDEELLNRCLVLSVDEGRTQTQAIHAAQRARRTLAGFTSPGGAGNAPEAAPERAAAARALGGGESLCRSADVPG